MPQLPIVNTETNSEFLENSYQNIKALIFQIDQAISYLLTNQHGSYKINTGQTEQSVTRLDLDKLRTQRSDLMSELNSLAARLGKTRSVVNVIPGF